MLLSSLALVAARQAPCQVMCALISNLALALELAFVLSRLALSLALAFNLPRLALACACISPLSLGLAIALVALVYARVRVVSARVTLVGEYIGGALQRHVAPFRQPQSRPTRAKTAAKMQACAFERTS